MSTISHFHRQIQQVKDDLLAMAGLVEQAIHNAAQALAGQDTARAQAVIQCDRRIDLMQN